MPRLFMPEDEGGKGDCSCHPFEAENHVLVMLRTFHFTPLTIHAVHDVSLDYSSLGCCW